jgi:hypothetical protein
MIRCHAITFPVHNINKGVKEAYNIPTLDFVVLLTDSTNNINGSWVVVVWWRLVWSVSILAIFSCLKLENETGAREREKKKRREKERKKRGRKGGKKSFPSLSYSHH